MCVKGTDGSTLLLKKIARFAVANLLNVWNVVVVVGLVL